MSLLLQSSGILDEAPDLTQEQLTDEVAAVLVEEAERFLLAGGTISYREWPSIPISEKTALVVAGQRLRREMAALIGQACEGPAGVGAVMEPVDGGHTKATIGLATAVAAAAQKRQAPKG